MNVFLGLGIPWLISSVYGLAVNKPYRVETDNLVSSVIIFSIVGTITIICLILRRKVCLYKILHFTIGDTHYCVVLKVL